MKPVLKRKMRYLKPYRLHVVFALICGLISVPLSLLSPILIGQAIDKIVGYKNVDFGFVFKLSIIHI